MFGLKACMQKKPRDLIKKLVVGAIMAPGSSTTNELTLNYRKLRQFSVFSEIFHDQVIYDKQTKKSTKQWPVLGP